jgi:AcrR family transcriptional regulator
VSERASLRAEQVAQTRQALVDAARTRFGAAGYAATSIDDIARDARVTIGALYHHFRTKAALFEAVFEQVHGQMLEAVETGALQAKTPTGVLTAAIDGFLDALLDPAGQQILIIDAPAVLGVSRFTELDEKDAFGPLTEAVRASGLATRQPDVLARLMFGMLTRAGMLIATAEDPRKARDEIAATMREIILALEVSGPGEPLPG